MGKVLFVMKYPLEEQYSIKHKLDGQMRAVEELGHDAYYTSFDRKHLYLNHGENREIIQNTTAGNSKAYYHLISFYDIYNAACKALRKEKFDLVYFRYGPLNVLGSRLLKTAAETSTLVVEIPTFPTDREKQKTALRRAYMKLSERRWRKGAKYISLFTIIGEKADSYLGVPTLNIDNGVSVESIPMKTEKKADDGKIHLLAVAAMSKWQGYDRIIQGLANWKSPRAEKYVIDLVGEEGDDSLEAWKGLTAECGLEKQVIFHGRMTGKPLTEIFETADVGLGSLGMYRKRMNSGSVLKIREYMARGLPFIYAHDDPDVSESMPWCIKFPNDETPIDMSRVDAFINTLGKQHGISERMRQYAIEHMSWEAQFVRIFRRVKEVTGKEI